ncbi:MAG: serine/threonine-protein kinase [Acidimicrobiales bacterium]
MTVLDPDTRIGRRYELGSRLASGAIGDVWHATDHQLQRPVAVKVVRPELAGNPEFRQAFWQEARAWASVGHPGTTWVLDFGEQRDGDDASVVYLVMELVDGVGLGAVIERRGSLEPGETLDLLAQAASTLNAAHGRGLVHGNLKPSNLLLRADGVLKVTDFGIARAVEVVPLADAHMEMASAPYRSPEQAAGYPATSASDLYSLGIVAYLCLTGTLPFAADGPVGAAVEHLTEDPRPLPASVPGPVASLVGRLLERDPSGRLSAEALALQAVGLCRQLGGRTTRPTRELLGGDLARLM